MADESGERQGSFATTRWSLVARAQDLDPEIRRQALGELLDCYYPALRAHLVLRRRIERHQAEDFIQGFVCDKILQRDLMAQADPAKGRFRSLLLRCLENYVVDQIRCWRAQKRTAEQGSKVDLSRVVTDSSVPCDVFDAAWARQVIAESLRRMECTCRERGREHIWSLFESRVLSPTLTDASPPPYEQVVRRFGFDSPEQASNALITAKRQFKRIIESVVAEYVDNDQEIDDEIRALRQILASSGPLHLQLGEDGGESATPHSPDSVDIDQTNPRLLARILELEDNRDTVWAPLDLGDLLRHQLSQPLSEFLPDLDATGLPGHGDQDSRQTSPLTTLGDLLDHPEPPLELLWAVKRLARNRANASASTTPIEIDGLLYFASIAAALVRHRERITRSSDDVLRHGFELMLERPWFDETIAQLLHEGLHILSQPS